MVYPDLTSFGVVLLRRFAPRLLWANLHRMEGR
jgi:hypothetical protein